MILIKETQGDTLIGDIDGSNTDYQVSFNFNIDSVNVYVNGRLKIKDWDDGFWTIAPRTVRMKEALLAGDSLEVEYKSDVKTGGGADGGCPQAPSATVLRPDIDSEENQPDVGSVELKPTIGSDGENRSVIDAGSFRPVILPSDTEDQCP